MTTNTTPEAAQMPDEKLKSALAPIVDSVNLMNAIAEVRKDIQSMATYQGPNKTQFDETMLRLKLVSDAAENYLLRAARPASEVSDLNALAQSVANELQAFPEPKINGFITGTIRFLHKNGYLNHPAPAAGGQFGWRPISEWNEDIGECFWTSFPVAEPYYSGSPLDTNWPGTHTHFIPMTVFRHLIDKDGNLKQVTHQDRKEA